ncbi:MAG TPA: DUF423 domain-containing protein [Bacteroidetes bacterium]|nr:MAG: hypothetical protein A2X68_07410 [Ignavibacteria bacterium GWC2_56_12]HAV23560.1 DUF423 domain-containing protein [Bacteroidota bacterium]
MKLFAIIGALGGLSGVALGAFGAHSLKGTLTASMLDTFETGARYQMYHSLALLVVAWAVERFGAPLFTVSGWCFVAGIVLFSGSLYILAFTGIRWIGAITPIGGLAFLAGWGMLAYGFWKNL